MKSIKHKLYVFVISIVLAISIGAIVASYTANSRQIDKIYKNITSANADNFASTLDGDYLGKLRVLLESDEYQTIHAKATEEKNEQLIQDYLESKGMWKEYCNIRAALNRYINSMDEIKYVYIVAHGNENAKQDMYMIDDYEQTLYEATGRWEDREDVYLGQDLTKIDPDISYSDTWGWLVSNFAPVYDSNGNCVCIVGCDVDYSNIVNAKIRSLVINVIVVVITTIIVIIAGLFIISKNLIKPLKEIADAIKLFNPAGLNSIDANVISLNINRDDEIGEIYNNIRANQLKIVDYLKDINEMSSSISQKDSQINHLNIVSYKDALTHVGNKAAYMQKMLDLNNNPHDYAIVMIDINDLKAMNDKFGHKAGDYYLQGCCQLICKVFKHSPVYRIGGDEFVVIVENQDYIDRQQKFEELEKAFEVSYNKESDIPWEKLSASCGMAELSSDDNTAELVFKRADKHMYENKAKFKTQHGSYR